MKIPKFFTHTLTLFKDGKFCWVVTAPEEAEGIVLAKTCFWLVFWAFIFYYT